MEIPTAMHAKRNSRDHAVLSAVENQVIKPSVERKQ